MRNKKASPIPYNLVQRRQMSIPAVLCPVCNEWMMMLTHAHAKNHGMTKEEFCVAHPEISDIFYWGDLASKQARARFAKWKKRGESKKGPPGGRPSSEG